jgi:hypothetical protein
MACPDQKHQDNLIGRFYETRAAGMKKLNRQAPRTPRQNQSRNRTFSYFLLGVLGVLGGSIASLLTLLFSRLFTL